MVVGIIFAVVYWTKKGKDDVDLLAILLAGIAGGFLGAKLAYLFAEGWLHLHEENRWMHWVVGKSVMGSFLGGWMAVEWMKKRLGYKKITGDLFAQTLPLPLFMGRIGCLHAGCCKGIIFHGKVWPAVTVEMIFLAVMALVLFVLRRRNLLVGMHFYLFLVCYSTFRFCHEFLRDTPKVFWGISGYQIIAVITALAAVIAWRRRFFAMKKLSA